MGGWDGGGGAGGVDGDTEIQAEERTRTLDRSRRAHTRTGTVHTVQLSASAPRNAKIRATRLLWLIVDTRTSK